MQFAGGSSVDCGRRIAFSMVHYVGFFYSLRRLRQVWARGARTREKIGNWGLGTWEREGNATMNATFLRP